MSRLLTTFIAGMLSAIAPAVAAPPPADPVVRELVLDRPTIIAFLPASLRGGDESQTPTPAAWATQALGRVKWCLGARAAAYHLFYADRIIVHLPESDEIYEISDAAPLPGALLLSPDESTRIIFAGNGAQSLVPLLQQAASEYFNTSCPG